MTVGERIKNLRKERGYSQESLSKHLHVSRQAVSKWEQNVCQPSLEDLTILAELFCVDLTFLITGAQPQATHSEPQNKSLDNNTPTNQTMKPSASEKTDSALPFWTVKKENIFLLTVSAVAFLVYFIQHFILWYSMTLFLVIEGCLFTVSTLATLICDPKAKTKNGFLALLLPLVCSLLLQALVGLAIEL